MAAALCVKLPIYVRGIVVQGFGRGSKELGIPTANFPESVVESVSVGLDNGIYFGLATVNGGTVYKMVMSVGWNPYYKNQKKSMETHVLHAFDNDFYGAELSVILLGFIRAEKNFATLDELIKEIRNDIKTADSKLEEKAYSNYFRDPFLTSGQ